ncbi:MAG TPA: MurR/RpiR family transcriptional regulator [Jatrophihabitans sp.]|nr:MurR/RpiR family transcriptional regulator [Jatrophihabitans sp.]
MSLPGTENGTDVLVRIRGALPSLQPAARRVGAVILADPAAAAQLSISALASAADTSAATVMRFCRAVGFANDPQLRLGLAGAAAREDALVAQRPAATGDIDPADTLRQVVDKIAYNEARALEETAQHLNLDTLDHAVGRLVGARRIDIFGTGASGLVGLDLHQKLHRIGLLAFVWTDPHSALTAAALLGSSDVALAISHSGSTTDTIEPLRLAAERGATTIAVTNFAGSALARAADLVLTTTVREPPFRSGATVSRIAQLALVDFLFVGVAQRCYGQAGAALSSTFSAIHRGRARGATRRRPS